MQFYHAVIKELVEAKVSREKAQNLSLVADVIGRITAELQRLEEIHHTIGDLQANRVDLYSKYLEDGAAIDTQLSNVRRTCEHWSKTGVGTCRICGTNVMTGLHVSSNGIPSVPSDRRRLPVGPIRLDYEMLKGICDECFEPMKLTLPPDEETGLLTTSMVKYLVVELNKLADIQADLFKAGQDIKVAEDIATEARDDAANSIGAIQSKCPHTALDSNGRCCICGLPSELHNTFSAHV